jgi:hypothetical protein
MTPPFDVGAFVWGPPAAPRALVRHADLLAAYADGAVEDDRESYLSHFAFGPELQAHHAANRGSVAGFVGPCWCRWVVLDIDRADPADALEDTRRLVKFLHQRYPEADGDVPIYFSGGKGFHVLIELAHNPPPAVGFNHTAHTFAEAVAGRAGVRIDGLVYDLAHIIRLPNTRHPRTGLYKRRVDAEALFALGVAGIRNHARHPAGDGIPAGRSVPAALAADWRTAKEHAARGTEARAAARRGAAVGTPDERAPRYLLDFLSFGVAEGERHQKLFCSAAWLTEQGAPPALVAALLTEPGRDVGLTPKEVSLTIQCGIKHARRQRAAADPRPDPDADPDNFERWAIRHEDDPALPRDAYFPFGALAARGGEGGPA